MVLRQVFHPCGNATSSTTVAFLQVLEDTVMTKVVTAVADGVRVAQELRAGGCQRRASEADGGGGAPTRNGGLDRATICRQTSTTYQIGHISSPSSFPRASCVRVNRHRDNVAILLA